MNKSVKQKSLETRIIKRLKGVPLEAAKLLFADPSLQAIQEYANVVSIKRLGFNDHGPVHVDNVVVDDGAELLRRLRALYGIKNFIGARIVALGGPWGKYAPDAPQVARDRYRLNIIDVPYEQVSARIEAATKDR
ncbi:MAG TPA: hypothetical protein PL126_04280, partial [Candidatus Cloacimonadota bacterium]|nr:hypothetical protein [Candidatus Cloacimonadota bacterium]